MLRNSSLGEERRGCTGGPGYLTLIDNGESDVECYFFQIIENFSKISVLFSKVNNLFMLHFSHCKI